MNPSDLNPEDWVPLPEAAEAWDTTEKVLRNRIKDGTLTAIRVGRGYRVRLADVGEAFRLHKAGVAR